MARRKAKGNPKRVVKGKTEDEQAKTRLKISGPKELLAMESEACRETTVLDNNNNTWTQRRTRFGPSRSVQERDGGATLKDNEQSSQACVFLNEQIEEQNADLGEFAKAIGRFHREAQLQMKKKFSSHDGEEDDFVNHGGESYLERDNIHISADDARAPADVNVAAGAGMDDDADANAVANAVAEAEAELEAEIEAELEAEANVAEIDCALLIGQPITKDDHVEKFDNSRKQKDWDPTTLSNLTKTTKSSLRKVVEYNENGQTIGPVAVELASYMGSLARYLVPVTHKNWKEVPNTLKEKLWNFLEQRFVLDPRSRKMSISAIGDKWRCFKSELTRKHILPFKDDIDVLTHPPRKYGFIKQEHWDEFVKFRLSDTFQALHETQSKIRSKYIYPARLGRRGYAHLAEELKKSGFAPDEIDRSLLWKKARQNKKGEYVSDAIKEKAMIIDELNKKRKGAPLVNDVNCDVLTLALGTPEKPGRVRGMGQYVTPTSFLHTPKCGTSGYSEKLEEHQELIESKLHEEKMSRLKVENKLQASQDRVVQLEEQLARMINQGIPPTPNRENDCSNTNEPTDSNYGKSMDDGTSPSYPKSRNGKELVNISHFQAFYKQASRTLTSKLSSISVQVDDAIFGTEIELFLDLDDIRYICEMEDLSANCLMVYMRHLYCGLALRQMQGMCAFLYPTYVSAESGEHFSNAIIERLQTTKCQWFFVPVNPEDHWILVAINLCTMGCYWMDPLGLPDQHNIKPLINIGLKALQVDGRRRSNPIWQTVKCPKQSSNNLCGFYVLRYIRDLLCELPNPLMKKEPFKKLSYSQDDIDEIRMGWCCSVRECM